jgi:pectate lyase
MEAGFQWSRPGSLVLYVAVVVLCAAVSEANIGEFDDYWRQRKLMADAAAEATYRHDPVEVVNQLNHAVHRQGHHRSVLLDRDQGHARTHACKIIVRRIEADHG